MNPERWKQVSRIYGAVLTTPESDRQAAVVSLCADDAELQREVESLLASGTGAELLDRAAVDRPSVMAMTQGVAIGSQIGVFRIDALLGVGGMGEVYRARDTKLNRNVAVKILPPAFANDPDRLARFKREAQVLAALNQPNIAAIYGLEGQDGQEGKTLALVMELVDGPTLADRIARGALPIDEALAIARQIADALEAAHEQGIVHRDLKPANIKVREDGTVKVLDFGLAKALAPGGTSAMADVTQSPTITTPAMTQAGMILGTAAYMSPEQAKGKPADKRSDIWAFGCVLYEMITGARAFEGDDVAETLAEVIKGSPDWKRLPSAPPWVRLLLERCLEKDRRKRLGDVAAIQLLLSEPSLVADLPRSAPTRLPLALTAAVVLTAFVTLGSAWLLRPVGRTGAVTKFALPLGDAQFVSARQSVALSADGQQIAYVANSRLFVRRFSEFDAHAVTGTEGILSPSNPVFAPDGRSLVYQSVTGGGTSNGLHRIAVSGGTPQSICEGRTPFGMSWDADGLVFSLNTGGIWRCPMNGRAPVPLVTLREGEEADGPQILPGGAFILFTLAKTSDSFAKWSKAQIVVQNLATSEREIVASNASDGRYIRSGHLVYAQGGIIYAAAFDLAHRRTLGEAVPVIEGVRRASISNTSASQLAISDSGVMAYIPGPTRVDYQRWIRIAERDGTLKPVPVPPAAYVQVRLSRNGQQLVAGSDDGSEPIVWVYPLNADARMRRLTLVGRNRFPIWAGDDRVAFQSDRGTDLGIWWQRADGVGTAERLTTAAPGETHVPEAFSPDGQFLLFSVVTQTEYALSVLSLADRRLSATDIRSKEPIGAVFSPDGHWIAYATNSELAAGAPRGGVFVRPFPLTGDVFQVPKVARDFHPVWSSSSELLFVPSAASGQIAALRITTNPTLVFGRTDSLPARVTDSRRSGEGRAFDVLPGGGFIGLIDASDPDAIRALASPEIRVTVNWFDELNARVPAKQ